MNKPCFEYDEIGLSPQDMEEVYACSQGMFGGGELNTETTEPFIIGGFIEDREKSEELFFPTVANVKDILKNETFKKNLNKIAEKANKKNLINVTSYTDYKKFNKGKAKYDSLSKAIFFDPTTKIGLFRNNSAAYIGSNMIKQTLGIKNQTYHITAVFTNKEQNELHFYNVISIKVQKDKKKSKEYWDPTIYGEEGYNLKNNEDYIFIRLLNTKYKNNLLPAAQLDKVIQGIDKKGKLDRVYNHCTISNYISDYFYGLSLGNFSDNTDLHIEQVTKNDKNRLLSTGDTNSSIYTVYGIKVKNTEYASIKKFLEDSLKDPKITYNVLQLPIIGFKKIVNNLETDLNQIFKRSTEDAKQNLLKSMTKRLSSSLVCSSFVAYVIYKFTSIGKKMDVKNIKYGNLTPNDTINKIPGTEYMFSGTWNTYNSDLADFLTKNPQFNKYLKKKEGKK